MNEEVAAAGRAEALVRVRTRQPGGPWFVDLVELLPEPVRLGPFDNPSIAHGTARKLRQYLAALIRQNA